MMVVTAIALGSCVPVGMPHERPPLDVDLKGDPAFDRLSLSSEQSVAYDGLLASLQHPDILRAVMAMAASDDVYVYSRVLYSHVQAVLVAFRMTGDLVLLDHVDMIAEQMRAQLADGWRGTNDGSDGTKDGYLNWVFRSGGGSDAGKDLRRIDEMGAHGNVAAIAYALHVNRDLVSPSGRRYGANADFWRDYLVNHFEAKWRKRTGVTSGFPIMTRPFTVTYIKWIRWHYYMGMLTGNEAYLAEARRMADEHWKHMYPIATPAGTAYVWAHGMKALDGPLSHELHATTYAGHVYGTAVEFFLEGFHQWRDEENLRRLARTFTQFIIDTTDPIKNGMASDVGGGKPRLHLEPAADRSRLGNTMYRDRNYGLIGPWDPTGKVHAITTTLQRRYDGRSNTALLSSALLLGTFF
jgi:hypothetical protein